MTKLAGRKKETNDVNFTFEGGMLQKALYLIKEELGDSAVLQIFNENGIYMDTEELEDILCLERGYLAEEKKTVTKPKLKLIK